MVIRSFSVMSRRCGLPQVSSRSKVALATSTETVCRDVSHDGRVVVTFSTAGPAAPGP